MSNYYIMGSHGKDGQDLKVIFHLDVPDEDNFAGTNFRTALKDKLERAAQDGIITSEYFIEEGAGLTSIQNGEVYETVQNIRITLSHSDAEKNNYIANIFSNTGSDIINDLKKELNFWVVSG